MLEHIGGTAMGKGKRAALYVRVSTDGQTTVNQERELREVAERHGWNVVAVHRDHAISGRNGREKRPGLRRAVAQGKKLGRPRVDHETERKVLKLLKDGVGIKRTARTIGVGVATVQRIKAAS